MPESSITVIDPDGDIILVCGGNSGDNNSRGGSGGKIQVSSHFLAHYSPVLKPMLRGEFKEAQELRASSVTSYLVLDILHTNALRVVWDRITPYQLRLPDDDHQCMLMICEAMYHKPVQLVRDVAAQLSNEKAKAMTQLCVRFSEHCDKYDVLRLCDGVLKAFAHELSRLHGLAKAIPEPTGSKIKDPDPDIILVYMCHASVIANDSESFKSSTKQLSLLGIDSAIALLQSLEHIDGFSTAILCLDLKVRIFRLHLSNKDTLDDILAAFTKKMEDSTSLSNDQTEKSEHGKDYFLPPTWQVSGLIDHSWDNSEYDNSLHDFLVLNSCLRQLAWERIGPFASAYSDLSEQLRLLKTIKIQASLNKWGDDVPSRSCRACVVDWNSMLQYYVQEAEKRFLGLCLGCCRAQNAQCESCHTSPHV